MTEQNINLIYNLLLEEVLHFGDKVITRNSEVYSHCLLENITFTQFPLITTRKPAWKKAIKEMEWFMSGDEECPVELLDWWKGQLFEEDNMLLFGYSYQFRHSSVDEKNNYQGFDQVKFILDGLKNNPSSRRLILTSWNSQDMSNITEINENPNTPTSCHSIVVQFFVRNKELHMKTYQRSADMLLGVPHNWIQSWAMLLYFAYHSGLKPGSMTWMWGDAHIYNEKSHIETVNQISHSDAIRYNVSLEYKPDNIEYDSSGVPVFKTEDFYIVGEIPEPLVKIRPKLI